MAANYPASLFVKDAAGANLSTNPHSVLHDDLADEIAATQAELGVGAKGTSANVAARLNTIQAKTNGIVAGSTSGTTDGNGNLTITFGVTFASPPVVVATVLLSSTQQITCHYITSATTTQQAVKVTSNDAQLASTSLTIRWIAIGTLA